jgi:hypothetical protein
MKTLLAVLLLGATLHAAGELHASCDIAQRPAATLLLPYFEIDLGDARGETTLLTLTNVSDREHLAHVTLWTDHAYPILTFDVPLTGYDVQSIDLRDVIAHGHIAGAGSNGACGELPSQLEPATLERLRKALTTGNIGAGCTAIGDEHPNAIGYATVDVVQSCTTLSPSDRAYYGGVLAYDNVLTGEYQQLNVARGYAEGGTLVHIRAVDEELPQTFYGRFQDAVKRDRRQPLPATFAVQWERPPSVVCDRPGDNEVSFKVWREPAKPAPVQCSGYRELGIISPTEYATFDDEENAISYAPTEGYLYPSIFTNATSRLRLDNEYLPEPFEDADSGWLYLNLNADEYHFGTQSWVIVSTRSSRGSRDVHGSPLASGCTPAPGLSEMDPQGLEIVGPPPANEHDGACEISLRPAATLLLPRFDVDVTARQRTTRFTITNVSNLEYVARVTLWSVRAEAVLTFNIYLTGYDVQKIDLYDVLALGLIAPVRGTGFERTGSPEGDFSGDNPRVKEETCRQNPREIPPEAIPRMRQALGAQTAAGYATIDVVRNCGTRSPYDAAYFRNDLLFDNVLIGDYENEQGEGASMVHIRANRKHDYADTFYGRFVVDGRDARQPLPEQFAARWLAGETFDTDFAIWRDANALVETVRFDEDENATASFNAQPLDPLFRANIDDELFPPNVTGAPGGWMYIDTRSQAWVTSSLSTSTPAGTLAVDGSVVVLGDACSP